MNEHWRTLDGWFDYPDVYDAAVDRAQDGDTLVEVGVAFGRSLCYLIARARESGKRLRIVGVDRFTENSTLEEVSQNAKLAGCDDQFSLFAYDSAEAATQFEDASLAFVFIDADHTYDAVKRDIKAWLPKIKPGGVLAGHDLNDAGWPDVRRAVSNALAGRYEAVSRFCWQARIGEDGSPENLRGTGRKQLYLATPFYHESCTLNYFFSMMNELRPLHEAGYSVWYQPTVGDAVNRARNFLAAIFLEKEFDPLVFVDSDNSFTAGDLIRMERSGLPVVCANYPKRDYFFSPNATGDYRNGEQLRDALLEGTARELERGARRRGGMLEIAYAGTGLMMVRRQVFLDIISKGLVRKLNSRKLTPAHARWYHRFFSFEVTPAGHPLGEAEDNGEDWNFCDLVRAAGHSVWLDTEARSSHAGLHTFEGRPRLFSEIPVPLAAVEAVVHGAQTQLRQEARETLAR